MTGSATAPALVMPSMAVRARIRAAISASPPDLEQVSDRSRLEAAGRALLARLALGEEALGFALVELSNAAWRPAFAAVPTHRRLLLLPHCLRRQGVCRASVDAEGLHCAACGACDLDRLSSEARALGYRVRVAEGTGFVDEELLLGGSDAVLGVACLESLERSFARVAALGVPHLALPLESGGCRDSQVEDSVLLALLHLRGEGVDQRSWLPLLRAASQACAPAGLARLLPPHLDPVRPGDAPALAWLARGGKRLRAFVCLAAWAVGARGGAALSPGPIPDAALRLALAVEVLHKASLVHDDIEDASPQRYGLPTLHCSLGLAPALNLGDLLVGLGYRLAVEAAEDLRPGAGAAAVRILSEAQLALCRGQAAEFSLRAADHPPAPLEVLAVAAEKTAPAFTAALQLGLAAAGCACDQPPLGRFARCLGEAFQARDDCEDLDGEVAEALAQPTLLRAFAAEAGHQDGFSRRCGESPQAHAQRLRDLLRDCGAAGKARRLAERLRERALAAAEAVDGPLRELCVFVARAVLPG